MDALNHFTGLNASHIDNTQPAQLTGLYSTPSLVTVAIGFVICWEIVSWINQPKLVTNARYVGHISRLEPTWLLRLRWSWQAKKILTKGYQESKDTPFVIRRWDRDITILPQKYLHDIRSIPNTKLNAQIINAINIAGEYTGLSFVIDNNLLFRALTNKLTAELPKFIDLSKCVLDWAAPPALPDSVEWTEVQIEHATRQVFSRISTNFVLGPEASRNTEWCEMAAEVSVNAMTSGLLLGKFPAWTRPIMARVLPSLYKLRHSQTRGAELVTPILERWKSGLSTPTDKDTILHWMLEHGRDDEKTAREMALRVNANVIASVHTNSMTTSSILFNLCAHPEYIDVLREEIAMVTKELGPMGAAGPETLQKQWLPKLEKMDSFISETLRVHQPILFAPTRMAMENITLKDGTLIPKNTWVSFPSANIMMDPSFHPDPDVFDGLRNYRKRQASSEPGSKHLATQPTLSDLSFGYGNRACPGRFFAVSLLKMVVTNILLEYDIKYARDKNPYNNFEEFSFILPTAKLMLKKRTIS